MAALFALTTAGAVTLSLSDAQAATPTAIFPFTGAPQTWTVPSGVSTVHVTAYGAQGGGDYGGFGAAVVADLPVTAGQQLIVRVGGRGSRATGGFNGGGGSSFAGAGLGQGQGGGGASDISLGDVRLVVAGGGGGSAGGPDFGMGGSAGGATGEDGVDGSGIHRGGSGGTAAQAGSGGGAYAGAGAGAVGGNGGFNAGGGGGGRFGGGGGGGDSSGGSAAGGGAGSSYAAGNATFVQGARVGDGEVDISWGGTPAPDSGTASGTTFAFTGAAQLYQVPAGVSSVGVRAVGAQGGTGTSRAGYGADVAAKVAVTAGQVLAVLAGGRGGNGDGCGALTCGDPQAGNSIGGFNGGGTNTFAGAGTGRGTGGGGATDLRRGSWRLENRVVVAGGGGGSSVNGSGVQPGLGQGGDASGLTGDDGVAGDGNYVGGKGGSQDAGGAGGGAYAGAGGRADGGSGGFFGGSGGGGWFGGGGGGGDSSGGSPGGGGAGASHVTSPIGEATYAPNPFGGDGQLTLTVDGPATPTDPPSTSPSPTPSTTPTPSGPATYVALGDSYASGEGATRFLPGTSFPDPAKPGSTTGCHRSDTSWAYGVYDALKNQQRVQDFQFVACSGAVFDRLYGVNDRYRAAGEKDQPAQLDAVARHNTVVATLSMGGNDVGFEPILQACVSYFQSPGGFGCSKPGTEAYTTAKAGMDALRTGVSTPSSTGTKTTPLAQVYEQIVDKMASGGTLYVAGYPHLFSAAKKNYPREVVVVGGKPRVVNNCHVGTGDSAVPVRMAYEDAVWINKLVDAGDAVIDQAVIAANTSLAGKGSDKHVVFVDIRNTTFDNHTICSGDKWFNGAQLTIALKPKPKQTSFHPNARGQQEYARVVKNALTRGRN